MVDFPSSDKYVKGFTTGGTKEHRGNRRIWRHYLRTCPHDKNFQNFLRNFLHLWKFAVISQLRTNFADNARKSQFTLGAA